MDLVICSNCGQVFDTDNKDIREDSIDVCPVDTADERYEITYECPYCGYVNVYCYCEKVKDE